MASRQRNPEFRVEAVRIALTSGLRRKQVASDLCVGFSTLNSWNRQDRVIQLSVQSRHLVDRI